MNDKIFQAFAPVRTPFARVREFIIRGKDSERRFELKFKVDSKPLIYSSRRAWKVVGFQTNFYLFALASIFVPFKTAVSMSILQSLRICWQRAEKIVRRLGSKLVINLAMVEKLGL